MTEREKCERCRQPRAAHADSAIDHAFIPPNPTCEERVENNWESRKEDLERLWAAYCEGDEDGPEDLGNIYEYGLSFDYVAPNTFQDQEEGYWRYQLSWGGPSDEIRFFASSPDAPLYKAEYWFLNWFDGAKLHVKGESIVKELWTWFQEAGSTQHAYDESMG